jgi:hypothetical protein
MNFILYFIELIEKNLKIRNKELIEKKIMLIFQSQK